MYKIRYDVNGRTRSTFSMTIIEALATARKMRLAGLVGVHLVPG